MLASLNDKYDSTTPQRPSEREMLVSIEFRLKGAQRNIDFQGLCARDLKRGYSIRLKFSSQFCFLVTSTSNEEFVIIREILASRNTVCPLASRHIERNQRNIATSLVSPSKPTLCADGSILLIVLFDGTRSSGFENHFGGVQEMRIL